MRNGGHPGKRGLSRTLRLAACALALACAAPAHAQFGWVKSLWPSTKKPEPPTSVQDPHYGDSLFYFYQGRYFSAVTNLMVSQHFDRMPKHADEAEVLRGGLFLSYGLHREAGEIFAKLIEKGAPPPVRDRAWFYLAKIRYQRGLHAQAEEALARIERSLPADLQEDRVLLQAQLAMARGDYAGAARALDALAKSGKPGSDVALYARYNLGVAMIKGGEAAKGAALLDEVGRVPTGSEEFRSLRDKANVALGFSALQEDRAEDARRSLERVRLTGMLANKALLGFGWAAASGKNLNAALVPWTELAQRDPSDAAVLEAKLAVPYAYAELGAYGKALGLYQDAIGAFEQENARLDESIAAIRAGKLLAGLIERNPGEEMGWFWNIEQLPELPHSGHLAPVLAQHEFQEAFKNYRDLLFLARNLKQWENSLDVLRAMLANRRQAFAERLPAVREREKSIDLGIYDGKRNALQAELARVEREADVAAFADARERELRARIDSVRAIVERGGNDPEIAAARERLRRAAGALAWQQTQNFADRLWQAKKNLAELERNLGEAHARDAALQKAQRDEPAKLDAFAARIEALAARVKALQPRVAELAAAQQNQVQELAVAELAKQKERLAAYVSQARFAVAQIYDRANLAKGDGGAATR
ncbi:hypothetical protein FBR04_13090 [Betaproteobacteria bacterium PRO7]|jgi:tetratricopeptide (TPR) repeat protein|nr:hypothetical protein [Betaproteobacteria bacterium PRO7]